MHTTPIHLTTPTLVIQIAYLMPLRGRNCVEGWQNKTKTVKIKQIALLVFIQG
jgi:hypothetical protein